MLTIHQSNRLEALVPELARICAPPLSDPFTPERIVVPNTGMARWLSLALADAQGICLNVEFPLPATLVWEIWRKSLPDVPDESTFTPAAMTWRLMELLEALDEGAAAPLLAYLEGGNDSRRFDLASRIAAAFDQYLVYRPEMVLGWEDGRYATDHGDEEWQAGLWRELTAGAGSRHRARLLKDFLGSGAAAAGLPERLSVFGLPALPPAIFQVLRAVALHAEVHIFLVNPCRGFWMETLPERSIARIAGDQDPAELYLDSGNPLLSSMGGQGRDFLAMVVDDDCVTADLFHEPVGDSLLASLQRDILDLARPGHAGEPQHEVAADDESLLVRGSYSRMREVEALHDHLLHLFDTHPDLDPSDVRVMMPTIDEYAPLIEAVFGAAPDNRRIPFAIADLRARTESPVIDAFLALLELPAGRYEAPSVLALLEIEAVRTRFGITQDDLPRLTEWVRTSGIRWGVDGASRERLGLPGDEENSWRFGLDRMMFGYAMAGDGRELFSGVLPVDGVEGTDARLMGELQRFAGAVTGLAGQLEGARPVAGWCDLLAKVGEEFFERPIAGEELDALRLALETIRDEAAVAGFVAPVSLDVVRAALEDKLGAPGAAWAFLSGRVTFCTLVPMRSVPAEVVCLLGLNDGEFPRSSRPPSFDLMVGDFKRGDRARRDDDRYLFLEALLSARRALYLSHVSRSPRDNSEAPPSLLLAELEDAVREAFVVAGTETPPKIRLEHRLQAFSPRYFAGEGPLFSYREDLAAALTRRATHPESKGFLAARLPEPDAEWRTISVARLARFFRSPAKYFLQERLGIRLDEAEASVPATESFGFDALEAWQLREDLLVRGLAGENVTETAVLMRAAGRLPHGHAGPVFVGDAAGSMEEFIVRVAAAEPAVAPRTVPIDLMLDGFRIVGEIEQVYGEERFAAFQGRKKGANFVLDERRLIEYWVEHLILSVAGVPVRTHCLAPGDDRWIEEEPDAREHLADLLAFYWEGLREPLAFFPRLAEKFFNSRVKEPMRQSRVDFANPRGGTWMFSPELKMIWPNPDEAIDERYEAHCRRIWGPLHHRLKKVKKKRKAKK
ncbi:MAG: exodeoxyribonuclease V subunit gamma [Deltaproteobacteria bacterium]